MSRLSFAFSNTCFIKGSTNNITVIMNLIVIIIIIIIIIIKIKLQ